MLEEYNGIFDDLAKRMNGAIERFKHSLAGLRTGRASASLLDPVKIEIYGNSLPINQVGTVTSPESRMLTVQVWDKNTVKLVEKAIINAGLGLNPMVDGQLIRLPLPDLSEERRKELVKKAKEYSEQYKIAIRNIRRDGLDEFRNKEKNHEISEDIMKLFVEKIQKLTDQNIVKVDELLDKKSVEIMEV